MKHLKTKWQFNQVCKMVNRGDIKEKSYTYKEIRELSKEGKPNRGKILTFINQKGGVGKTLSALNTILTSHMKGRSVLGIDIDGQANLSSRVCDKPYSVTLADFVADVFHNEDRYDSIRDISTQLCDELFFIGSNSKVADLNSDLDRIFFDGPDSNRQIMREEVTINKDIIISLMEKIGEVRDFIDLTVIDASPAKNTLNVFMICFSDLVVIPMGVDDFSMSGTEDLVATIHNICGILEVAVPTLRVLINDRDEDYEEMGFEERVVGIESMNLDSILKTKLSYNKYFKKSIQEKCPVWALSPKVSKLGLKFKNTKEEEKLYLIEAVDTILNLSDEIDEVLFSDNAKEAVKDDNEDESIIDAPAW
mgnify:CR=1 FL=1